MSYGNAANEAYQQDMATGIGSHNNLLIRDIWDLVNHRIAGEFINSDTHANARALKATGHTELVGNAEHAFALDVTYGDTGLLRTYIAGKLDMLSELEAIAAEITQTNNANGAFR